MYIKTQNKYKSKSEKYIDVTEKIDPTESYWTIEDGKSLNLFIDKAQDLIWKSDFKGHKEIDTKKVDNSKRVQDFDNDTQVL